MAFWNIVDSGQALGSNGEPSELDYEEDKAAPDATDGAIAGSEAPGVHFGRT